MCKQHVWSCGYCGGEQDIIHRCEKRNRCARPTRTLEPVPAEALGLLRCCYCPAPQPQRPEMLAHDNYQNSSRPTPTGNGTATTGWMPGKNYCPTDFQDISFAGVSAQRTHHQAYPDLPGVPDMKLYDSKGFEVTPTAFEVFDSAPILCDESMIRSIQGARCRIFEQVEEDHRRRAAAQEFEQTMGGDGSWESAWQELKDTLSASLG